jgi:hypothetical protein
LGRSILRKPDKSIKKPPAEPEVFCVSVTRFNGYICGVAFSRSFKIAVAIVVIVAFQISGDVADGNGLTAVGAGRAGLRRGIFSG